MNTTTRSSTAECVGRCLGQTWYAYLRRERRVVAWLVSVGAPKCVATVLVLAVKLAVLGVFSYVAFWLALLILFAIAVAWSAGRGDSSEEDDWPFLDMHELRKTPGYDPVLYNDYGHPDYPDDLDD